MKGKTSIFRVNLQWSLIFRTYQIKGILTEKTFPVSLTYNNLLSLF